MKSPRKSLLCGIPIDIEVSPIVQEENITILENESDGIITKQSKKEVRFDSSANKVKEEVQVAPTQRPQLISGWSGEMEKVQDMQDIDPKDNNSPRSKETRLKATAKEVDNKKENQCNIKYFLSKIKRKQRIGVLKALLKLKNQRMSQRMKQICQNFRKNLCPKTSILNKTTKVK